MTHDPLCPFKVTVEPDVCSPCELIRQVGFREREKGYEAGRQDALADLVSLPVNGIYVVREDALAAVRGER